MFDKIMLPSLVGLLAVAAVSAPEAAAQTAKKPILSAAMGPPKAWNYLGQVSREDLEKVKAAGLNTIHVWAGHRFSPERRPEYWNDPVVRETFTRMAKDCRELGLDWTAMLYMGNNNDQYPDNGQALSMNEQGEPGTTACPFDERWWEGALLAPTRFFAGLGASAILLEIEVYGKGARIDGGGSCFSDYALGKYFKDRGIAPELPKPAERKAWFEQNGKMADYVQWEEEQFRELSRRLVATAREKSPACRFGYYTAGSWKDTWAFRALAQGLYQAGGTPLIFLDATTYSGQGNSYNSGAETYGNQFVPLHAWIGHQRRMVDGWGVKGDILFGLYTFGGYYPKNKAWHQLQSPQGIEKACVESALLADGYWFWNERGDVETLRAAAGKANARVREILADPRAYIEKSAQAAGKEQGEDLYRAAAFLYGMNLAREK